MRVPPKAGLVRPRALAKGISIPYDVREVADNGGFYP